MLYKILKLLTTETLYPSIKIYLNFKCKQLYRYKTKFEVLILILILVSFYKSVDEDIFNLRLAYILLAQATANKCKRFVCSCQ